MKGLFFAVIILWSGSVWAAESVPPECRVLPDHKPSADLAYQAGVDVNGKPVVPADLNAAPSIGTDQTLVVPLTIDLAKQIEGLDLKGTPGFLEIGPDGKVTYNGQDLTSQIHVLCGKKPADTLEYPPAQETTRTHEPAGAKKQ